MAQVPARQASAAQAPPIVEEPIPYQALLVPKQTILTNIKVMAVGQQSSRILEFDAVSGCQRAAVDCRFMPSAMELTPDGASLVLFAKTNAVAVYSTDTWACESSHALKSKKAEWSAVAICVAPGRPRPLVYFTVEGAPGLRMLDTGIASGAAARDAREGPAVKLKSENRAGILALAAYPGDPRTLLALTDDGCLVLARVSAAEGTWAPGYSLDLGLPAAEQQPQPHGGERASLHAVAHPLRRGCALVAVATRRAVLAVEVLDAREARVAFHPRSGELAALPRAGESAEPQPPSRLPTLQLLDAGDPAGCLGVPALLPLHSSLGFWTQRDGDGVVSRLRFPRYAHLVAGGRLAAHDLTHGLLTEVLAPPRASDRGQAHGLRSALRSPRRGLWEEAALLAASRAQWFLPGRGAAWLGAGHDQLAVLAESGRRLLVYDAAKLAGAAPPKALFSVELADAGARFAVAAVVSLPRAAGVPTSALWVGPALLVATAGGQVYLARWDGTALLLATLLAGPPASLLGALADRLLLAHDAGDGGAGVAPRALRTPELLVPGVGLMRGAVYSAMAGDWEPLVGALLGEWQASDSHPGPAPPGSALALQLAAAARVCQLYGRFGDARRLFQAAGAWPELLSLCVFQGDWAGLQQIARGTPKNVQGFAEQLLAVNENAFRGMAGKSPHGGRACLADWGVRLEARVEGTAEDPRTVLGEVAASRDEDQEEEDGGSGSERFAGDDTQHAWRPDGEVSQDTLDADADVDVAPAGRLPFMEATLLQTECTEESAGARTAGNDGAGAPIPPLEAGALASYAGLPGAVALRRAFGGSGASSGLAAGGASASPRPPSPSASDAAGGFEEEGSRHGGRGAGAASISRASDWGTESATSGGAGGAPTAGAGRVQDPRNGGSGQPPMAVDEDDDDDFFDSDDDEAFLAAALPGGAAAAAAVAAAAAPARWAGVAVGRAHAFPRISGCNVHGRDAQTATIRSLRDLPLFAIPACRAAGAAGTEPVDLLATGSRTPPSLASTHSGSKRFSFNIREGEGNVAGAAAAPSLKAAVQRYPAIQRSVSGASEDPFATLARAPSAASSAAGGQGAASDPFGLLALGSGVGGSQGQGTPSPVQAPSAGGSRHPSAGPGQASNLLAGWEDFEAMVAGDMLTRLVIADTEGPGANGIPTDEVQEFLNDCDRRGNGNATVAGGEDLTTFRSILASCASIAEVDDLVANVLQG
ncbi:hypothetical protein F751_6146 [Auxenochlorella protothecoides]|uniref:Uncharacterized protein n=1 Tax=Auxenochlorella protothecoides TaxID=3075 RepID=A0A087SHI7_AUXPR|nr:hypothetical protein F751_6146 [Auxenochlorella protothecoides]KFM25191.1 hypothetical protein F751_6146 [Auxenochlorella protothecoides]